MSISAPPGRPSIIDTLDSSFRDSLALTKKNAVPTGLLAAVCAVTAAVLVFSGAMSSFSSAALSPAAKSAAPNVPPAAFVPMVLAYILFFVVSYYALAAAVRTVHPEFGLTVGKFFGTLGYGILAGLLTMLAGICFIIPAYWVFPKVMLAPYAYLLGANGPIKTMWNATTGYYWQTVGMLLLAGLCIGVIFDVMFYVCIYLSALVPAASIVLYPLAAAVFAWMMHVSSLVYVRWTNALLPRANFPQAVPAPA